MTAFIKYDVGNKLFAIEWLLSVDNSEDLGDAFEAVDCEVVSISAYTQITSGSDPVVKVYHTNQSDFEVNPGAASNYVSGISDIGTSVLIPWSSLSSAVLPPPTRYLAPSMESVGVATCRISCLFRTL